MRILLSKPSLTSFIDVLITLPCTKYNKMIETYNHFKRISMNESDTKLEQLVHVILGASDQVKVKIQKFLRKGNEPIANKFKWIGL